MTNPDRPEGMRLFYNSELPASMRFTPIGFERRTEFNPALHLARLVHMSEQVYAADEDGDYLDIVRAEIDALIEGHPELREQLSNH